MILRHTPLRAGHSPDEARVAESPRRRVGHFSRVAESRVAALRLCATRPTLAQRRRTLATESPGHCLRGTRPGACRSLASRSPAGPTPLAPRGTRQVQPGGPVQDSDLLGPRGPRGLVPLAHGWLGSCYCGPA